MKVTVMSQALVPLLKGLGNVEDFANPVAKLSMPGEVGDVVVVQAGEGAVARTAATGKLSELLKHGYGHRDCGRIGRRCRRKCGHS